MAPSIVRRLAKPLLVVLLAAVAPVAAARFPADGDRVVLKSGRELLGRLEGERDHRVYFLDHEIGRVAIARRNVRTIVRIDEPPGLFAPLVLEPPDEPAPKNYTRYQPPADGAPGSLSTGVARFFHEKSRTTLFLVGAVHIGEPDYYARVQDILDSCDRVLFEGVGPASGHAAPDEDELASLDALTKLQLTLNQVLGLQFQRDGLDYKRDFWRNADVDYASLSERMKSEGVGLPTDSPLFRALMKFVVGAFDLSRASENPAMQKMLRRQVGSALAMSDMLMGGAFHKLGEVIIGWRNDAALRILDDELATGASGRWIALFYGAAHLPDFAAKLAARGFEYQRSGWIPAWTVE